MLPYTLFLYPVTRENGTEKEIGTPAFARASVFYGDSSLFCVMPEP